MLKTNSALLQQIAAKEHYRIEDLDSFFDKTTHVYIDYANVRPWAAKLGWHIDLKRLKQLFRLFANVQTLNLYHGTLRGDATSEAIVRDAGGLGYAVHTKPVKIMRISIDVTSISSTSSDILKNFIRSPLLRLLKVQTIEQLNRELSTHNQQGKLWLEDRKCNFDVEIGRDMLLDFHKANAETFVLWSGDSDFADPIEQLLRDGKKVFLFATARRVASELNQLRSKGLVIYEINKIRNFICRKSEIQPKVLVP